MERKKTLNQISTNVMFVNVPMLCATFTHGQMYGRYTQLSKFAKQFAASQRESARQGRHRKTLDIKEAKRRKSRTWSELMDVVQSSFML